MNISLICSDALKIPLGSRSVHMVVTSPPYYGLRDYGVDGQLGLEPLHDCLGWAMGTEPKKDCCFVCNARLYSMEIWRVLRDDGTYFLNLGDTYSGGGRGGHTKEKLSENWCPDYPKSIIPTGLKQKDLMGIPWRVALALQADGWYLRSDIVWNKPNPMPESVTDRPTKSHEYIFLLTKNKKYYYDADAIREDANDKENKYRRNLRSDKTYDVKEPYINNVPSGGREGGGRNKRTVWPMATRGYPGAHFATFPPELPETCIKAGTSEKGVCPECGNQWERIAEKELIPGPKAAKTFIYDERDQSGHSTNDQGSNRARDGHKAGYITAVKTIGWKPTCDCCHICDHYNQLHGEKECPQPYDPIPATVADVFGGSGTTGAVAQNLGRSAILLDINPDYIELQRARTGIKAMEEWQKGKKAEANLEGLPMFENVNAKS